MLQSKGNRNVSTKKKLNSFQRSVDIHKAAINYPDHTCLIPTGTGTLCSLPCCGSHSIQESVLKDRLALPDNSDVLVFMLNPIIGHAHFRHNKDSEWPKKRPYTDASRIPFACGQTTDGNAHDTKVFRCIEGDEGANILARAATDGIEGYEKALFLFDYRACLASRGIIEVLLRYLNEDEKRLKPQDKPNDISMHDWLKQCADKRKLIPIERAYVQDEILPELLKVKSSLDKIYLDETYDDMSHELLCFDSPVKIATASFSGSALLTVLPDGGGTRHTAMLSWLTDLDQKTQYEQRLEYSQHTIEFSSDWRALLRYILSNAYNTYTSVNYYDLTDYKFQRQVRIDTEKMMRIPSATRQRK